MILDPVTNFNLANANHHSRVRAALDAADRERSHRMARRLACWRIRQP